MGWLKRTAARMKRRHAYAGESRTVDDAVTVHLTQFVRTRKGVEAFIEPKTAVTQTTILLVAFDGEWTRRVVPSPEWGTPSQSTCRSRATTRRSWAIRSGCGTTTAGTSGIQTCADRRRITVPRNFPNSPIRSAVCSEWRLSGTSMAEAT